MGWVKVGAGVVALAAMMYGTAIMTSAMVLRDVKPVHSSATVACSRDFWLKEPAKASRTKQEQLAEKDKKNILKDPTSTNGKKKYNVGVICYYKSFVLGDNKHKDFAELEEACKKAKNDKPRIVKILGWGGFYRRYEI